ncbi:interferon-induced helicase C domain-containing protein 1 isoform X1 [Labrus mixtus]|uniref:interferon-induced helicase C domain-containing protein 1 isoform X1 n=1 Tax=Labrus mixtus TaxID=508554 RepID=UPI0029C0664C|nr:interferon-induced helicase C domain-containing protein 1 isoform X1 [Labrus mixtus]
MMASDPDYEVGLIEELMPSLRKLIVVERVLDHVHSIESDEKERISQEAKNKGDPAAVDLLIKAITKEPHSPGWFRAFVDALENSGLKSAADHILEKIKPEDETANEYGVKLIQILFPSLVEMKTDDVCMHCFSCGLLSQDDKEQIEATIKNQGNRGGARDLLKAIVRSQPNWYSTFLSVLQQTGHRDLYELIGGSPDCDKLGDKLGSMENLCSFKDEPAGCDVSMEDSQTAAGGGESMECMEYSEAGDSQDGDLCQGASVDSRPQPNSMELSQTDGTDLQAAPRGPERAHIVLRNYQMDVARPALEGKNIIICLPTGSGKTRVAVYITKTHLDGRRAEGRAGKVVVLVNKVPLVEQHYSAEFLPFLKHTYKVERVSGDSQQKISFTQIVKRNDVIICTAQILENYLERSNSGEDEGVNLSDLTLMVIDECHHTQKGGVYNHIMMRYLKQKHKNLRLKKEQKQLVPLPQILGLTASPGVGEATRMKQAEEHILRICANLDASSIMTSSLANYRKDPRTKLVTIEDRKQDPFGDVIKKIMNAIHNHAELSPTCELGSQNYEQWVVQKERTATTEEDHKVRVCAEHLRRYNEGLNLSNTIRMRDSFTFLNKNHEEDLKKKSPEEEHVIQMTKTERFLFLLFDENKQELQGLSDMPQYENDSLTKLRINILQEFSRRDKARGIIFTKTRLSAIALTQWTQENPKFADIGVKASYVIGGGDQSVVKPMTAAEQKDVLKKFGSGDVNLLIATSVAEEGLDIPACNIVIQYGHLTNEIGMIQARGRGRAEDSSFILIEVKNAWVAEKECVNDYRIDMMNKAIDKIRTLPQADYNRKMEELQYQSIMEERVRMSKKKKKDIKDADPSDVKFTCRGCSKPVCTGEDIQVIEDVHRVNVTPEFSELYHQTENTSLRERCLDYETNGFISCKQCGQRWGSMMYFKGIDCPSLHVKNFVVTVGEKKISKCNRWKDLAVKFSPFDYAEHARRMADSSDDDDI